MPIVLLILATVLAATWLFLLLQAGREDWMAAAYNKVLANRKEIEKLQAQDRENARRLAEYHGFLAKVMGLFLGGDRSKKIGKLRKENEQIQRGELKGVSVLDIPGYVLQRRVASLGKGSLNKDIYAKYAELFGRKYAANRTQGLIAQLLSYPIIGLALALAIGGAAMAAGNRTMGLLIVVVGSILVLFLVYALYDEVGDQVKKRRQAITRQFPNVVSKLALLATSGMIVDRAWKETAWSQEGELYQEMRKTAEERDNLVDPYTAYSNFIDRCATKETTKLASAIIQNQSKGNAEIGALLKDMAHEAWQERRHTAKRDSEAANSKLMIPTMMLFVAILIMIMVPIVTSFSGL